MKSEFESRLRNITVIKSFRNATFVGVLFAVALGGVSLIGCGKGESPASDPTATTSLVATADPQIKAEPNPVPAGTDKGKTTIMWHAGVGKTCEVYLVTRDGGETLFGGHAPKGRQEAPFITAGREFEFRLYEGNEHKKLQGSVKVTREKN